MSGASKILMGSGGVDLPSDDEFDNVSFLSHFDGSNNGVNNVFDDGSASNHTVSVTGNVTQGTFGPFARPEGEWSNYFDGTDGYLSVADSSDWDLGSGSYTVEAWVWAGAGVSSSYNMIVGQWPRGNNATTNSWIMEYSSGAVVGYAVISGAVTQIAQSATLPRGEWVHVALVRNGNAHNIYINGVVGATTTNTNAYDAGSGAVEVGGFSVLSGGAWDGYISNVRVVKGTAVYTSNFTPSTSALTAISGTVLLTCQSNRFKDNSASAHAITAGGTPNASAFTPFLTSKIYKPTVNGASAYFDGTGDYLTPAASSDFAFGTGDYTIEGWVSVSSTQTRGIFQLSNAHLNSTFNGPGFGIDASGGSNRWRWYTNGSSTQATHGSLGPAAGTWYHFAYVRNSGTSKVYIDGTEIFSATDSANYTNTYFLIGGWYSSSFLLEGYLSNFRIVKGTAVYTSNFTPPTAPLTKITNTELLLNMADGQALDSAAQNNMTLYGNAKTSTAQYKFGTASANCGGGSSDRLVLTSAASIGTGDFTIEMWIYFTAVTDGNTYTILDGRTASDTSNLTWAQETSGNWSTFNGAAAGLTSGWASSTFSTGQWYHVAQTRSGGLSRFFVDGTKTSGDISDSSSYDSTTYSLGGRYASAGLSLNGYIDDFRISHVARYTSNFTAPAEPFPNKGQ